MNMRLRLLAAAAVVLPFAGCATTSLPESGFLSDYSGLVREEGEKGVWVYRNPKTTYADYERVIIDPFLVGFGPHKRAMLVNAKELHELAKYMHDSAAKIVAEHYPVVQKPGKGTLRLRIALTRLEPSEGPGSAQAASGYLQNFGVALGEASFEGETLDSLSGERIHAFVAVNQRGSGSFAGGDRWGQAKAAMDEFGRRFREALDRAHGRK